MNINSTRLLEKIQQLGEVGRDSEGKLSRLAYTNADRAGRDLVVHWMRELNLDIAIDAIGNIHGRWQTPANAELATVMMGSHIDTVVNAGTLDGCYGVLAGLEVIASLQEADIAPQRPIVVSVFANEEGARFTPDMMGSLVYAGGLALHSALDEVASDDGERLGDALQRIGYAGTHQPGFLTPSAYLELHIEQGPILEHRGVAIGAVENLQGISWQQISVQGVANHAGTTPMSMRSDAGYVAAKVTTYVRELALSCGNNMVATVGTLQLTPDIINVVPSAAQFTVDLRAPDETLLREAEAALANFLSELAEHESVTIKTEKLARFEPVSFDQHLVRLIETVAASRQLSCQRMTSGAGHDAQMLARICPAAMIFVPSEQGISHNPREHTPAQQLTDGANVLLDAVVSLMKL